MRPGSNERRVTHCRRAHAVQPDLRVPRHHVLLHARRRLDDAHASIEIRTGSRCRAVAARCRDRFPRRPVRAVRRRQDHGRERVQHGRPGARVDREVQRRQRLHRPRLPVRIHTGRAIPSRTDDRPLSFRRGGPRLRHPSRTRTTTRSAPRRVTSSTGVVPRSCESARTGSGRWLLDADGGGAVAADPLVVLAPEQRRGRGAARTRAGPKPWKQRTSKRPSSEARAGGELEPAAGEPPFAIASESARLRTSGRRAGAGRACAGAARRSAGSRAPQRIGPP